MRHVVDLHLTDDDEVTLRVLAWASGRSESAVLCSLLGEVLHRAGREEVVRDALGQPAFRKLTPLGRRLSTGSDGTVDP